MFITFEGGEGTGKTTIIDKLAQSLKEKGVAFILTREPGGNQISEQIRSIILDPNNTSITPHTEALLYAASRTQHIDEVIKPALENKIMVICDRYLDSSLAYQGYARKLGYDFINKINDYALQYLPDLTFFFDLAPQEGLKRVAKRKKQDRLDLEKNDFHEEVRKGYLDIIKDNKRIKLVDASRTIDEIYLECLREIEKLL